MEEEAQVERVRILGVSKPTGIETTANGAGDKVEFDDGSQVSYVKRETAQTKS
jgi:hypothetical protein